MEDLERLYDDVKQVGNGAFGKVYQATDPDTGCKMALKVNFGYRFVMVFYHLQWLIKVLV